MQHWKTTAQSILSVLLATVAPLTAFLAAIQQIKPLPNYTYAYAVAAITFVTAVAKVWIGLLQNDAPDPTISTTATGGK